MSRRLHGLLGALATCLVVGVLYRGHPARGLFEDAGRGIARATEASHRAIGSLGVVDSGAPLAVWVFLLAVMVVGSAGSAILAGRQRDDGALRDEESALRIPAAALLGQGGGFLVALMGGGGAFSYGTVAFLAAGILFLPDPLGSRRPPRPAVVRPGPARTAGLLVLGAALLLASGGADGVLQSMGSAPPLPEAWFLIASESGAGWFRPPVLGLLAAVGFAAVGMEVNADRRGPERWLDFPVSAAAWALLLGPSNPVRALALAWSMRCMGSAGMSPAFRAAFAAALVGGMAGLVYA